MRAWAIVEEKGANTLGEKSGPKNLGGPGVLPQKNFYGQALLAWKVLQIFLTIQKGHLQMALDTTMNK